MIADNLAKMSREELVVLAMKQGLPKPHHKTKPASIIKLILDSVTHPMKQANEAQEKPAEEKEIVFATREQVEEVIAEIKAQLPTFQSIYDDVARCVTFRYNGAEDCMSLSLRLLPSRANPGGLSILTRAKAISRGRFALRGRDAGDFDRINATGKNAYTNVVLA